MFIVLFLTLSVLVYLWLKKRFSYWKDLNIPHLEPIIPYGNLKGIGSTLHFGECFRKIYLELKNDKLPLGGGYFFINPVIIPTSLELIKHIFIQNFASFHDRKVYFNERDDPISAHLVAVEGEQWRKLRQKITPIFSANKIKYMFDTVANVGIELTKMIDETLVSSGPLEVEIKDVFCRYTTDVIGNCILGIDCNSLKDPKTEFRQFGHKSAHQRRHSMGMELLLTEYPNFFRFFHVKLERDDMTEFFFNTLEQIITYREKNSIKRKDLVDIMIDLKNSINPDERLTFSEIVSQIYILFLAGFETTAASLTFWAYEMAMNQEVQDKARKEINAVLAKHNGVISYEAVMEMKYVHQVMDEVLRKHPNIPAITRKATKDFKVPDMDYTIPKDMLIIIPVMGVHYDPEIYPNPEKFDPDRFAPEEVKNRHPCAYIPFGEGPRNCVGLRFSKVTSYICIALLLKNFKFTASEKTQHPVQYIKVGFILGPTDHKLYLNVEKI